MITLRVWRGEDGDVVRYKLQGHSDAGESGTDVVCAAVSVLAIATANGLDAVAGATIRVEERTGYLDCIIEDQSSDGIRRATQAILETMVLGMRSIQDEHPDDLRVIEVKGIMHGHNREAGRCN